MTTTQERPRGKVIATWSGGIDSTGVIVQLVKAGWDVMAFTLPIYERLAPEMHRREALARAALQPHIEAAASAFGGRFRSVGIRNCEWIWNFSRDGIEIPRRNKHIMDYLLAQYGGDTKNIAMGEYVGADSWVVQDHVGAQDADHRHLSAYLLHEYGLDYRLISLQDFGPSRYKHERLATLIDGLGSVSQAALTTNCLKNVLQHCGRCYKCVERFAAFGMLGLSDPTKYTSTPEDSPAYVIYVQQMKGNPVTMPHAEVK